MLKINNPHHRKESWITMWLHFWKKKKSELIYTILHKLMGHWVKRTLLIIGLANLLYLKQTYDKTMNITISKTNAWFFCM